MMSARYDYTSSSDPFVKTILDLSHQDGINVIFIDPEKLKHSNSMRNEKEYRHMICLLYTSDAADD